MSYEEDRGSLHMTFLLLFFCIFSYTLISQDMTLGKKSADLFRFFQ